jgi:MFS family permease
VRAHPTPDLALINAAGFLRSFGVGLMGVALGIYLFRLGLSSLKIGLVIAAGLAGSALATVVMSLAADRLGRKRFLVRLSLLSAVGGIALAFSPSLPVLVMMAFVGMLNGTGTDRSAAFALDQAVIPGLVLDTRRTWTLAWYNVLLDGGGALGALAAGLPLLLRARLDLSLLGSYRVVFFAYAGLCSVVSVLYSFLSPAVEIASPSTPARTELGSSQKPSESSLNSRRCFHWTLSAAGF